MWYRRPKDIPGASGPTTTPPPGVGEPPVGGVRGVPAPGGVASGASVTAVQETGGALTMPQAGQRADNGRSSVPQCWQTVLILTGSRASGCSHRA